ncbi:MAG: YcaO-like family protein [Pseudomonadota bacterium]
MTPGFASRWLAEPEPKLGRLIPRTRPLAETLRRVQALSPEIPVTRLSDLSPLDPLRAPVFCAVTPLARDLTTHLGKGLTPDAARASALMEAVERVSAERSSAPLRRGCFTEVAGAVDPAVYDLPEDTAYAPDRPVSWLEGWCLGRGTPVWLAADLVLSPPREGVVHVVDTNGLAAGNTRLEAVLHGLCEVIERDVLGQAAFARAHGDPGEGPVARTVDPGSLLGEAAALAGRLTAQGHHLSLADMTGDIAVPVLRARLTDPRYPGPEGPVARDFLGYGCDPCAEVAVIRAMTEAAQALFAVVQGARDSYNESPVPEGPAVGKVSFAALPTFEGAELREDLAHVLERLRVAGFGAVHVVDLTRPDWDLPVVRVRVPGLSSYMVDPSRIGWRCRRWLL